MIKIEYRNKDGIALAVFPSWEETGINHGFTCRLGGNSEIIPGALNMALHVGDNPLAVRRNRRAVAAMLGIPYDNITTCAQVHGNQVEVVTAEKVGSGVDDYGTTIADRDGIITNLEGVPLMLFYADCVPVMFKDTVTGAIGLAHAGWRGTVGNIAGETLAAMGKAYGTQAKDVWVGIGPSIGPCCFEVDSKLYDAWHEQYGEYFTPHGEAHYLMDLWGINKKQVVEQGVKPENVVVAGVCTMENNDKFFSYRGEHGETGRLAAIIVK